MSATFLTATHIRRIERPRRVNASALRELTGQAHEMREAVENHWAELPKELRESFVDFAYGIVRRRQAWAVMKLFFSRARLALSILLYGDDNIGAYLTAIHELREAVLAAIERENPVFPNKAMSGLRQELEEARGRASMTVEEFDEWLKAPAANPV